MKRHEQRHVAPRTDAEVARRVAQALINHTAQKEEPMSTTAEILNGIWKDAKSGPVTVTSVAKEERINKAFAQSILGAMHTNGLLTFDEETFEYSAVAEPTALQVQAALDTLGNPDSETVADSDTTATPTKARTTRAKTATNLTDCLCGCKAQVAGKSLYKPGHDARHAGQVAREIVANYTTKGFDRRKVLAALPSDKLKAKAESIAERMIEKIEIKESK